MKTVVKHFILTLILVASPSAAMAQRLPATDSGAIGGDGGLFMGRLSARPTLEGFYENYFSPRNSLRIGLGFARPEVDHQYLRVPVDLAYNWERGSMHRLAGPDSRSTSCRTNSGTARLLGKRNWGEPCSAASSYMRSPAPPPSRSRRATTRSATPSAIQTGSRSAWGSRSTSDAGFRHPGGREHPSRARRSLWQPGSSADSNRCDRRSARHRRRLVIIGFAARAR